MCQYIRAFNKELELLDAVHLRRSIVSHPVLFQRDINFKVSQVTRQDVIHAGPKLIPAIFKVRITKICTIGSRFDMARFVLHVWNSFFIPYRMLFLFFST